MKSKITVSLVVALVAGFYLGTTLEADTQALNVSRITGVPYSQVLSPVARIVSLGGH